MEFPRRATSCNDDLEDDLKRQRLRVQGGHPV
jgi:hypothetical protein